VFVTGPPDKINLAKQAMIKLDVLDKQAQRDRRGEKISLQTYQVPAGTTESTAKMLQQFFRLPGTRINSVDAAQIVVCAPVADLVEIAELLKRAPPPQGAAGVFVLKDAEARKIASLVLDKLSKDPAAPLVRFDWSDNAVVVYGSPNQVEAVRLMIESLSGEKVQASQAHKGD
jgi:hypothetical protein